MKTLFWYGWLLALALCPLQSHAAKLYYEADAMITGINGRAALDSGYSVGDEKSFVFIFDFSSQAIQTRVDGTIETIEDGYWWWQIGDEPVEVLSDFYYAKLASGGFNGAGANFSWYGTYAEVNIGQEQYIITPPHEQYLDGYLEVGSKSVFTITTASCGAWEGPLSEVPVGTKCIAYERWGDDADIANVAYEVTWTVVGVDAALIDNDQDGYSIEVDCDDFDFLIYPGAPEVPNDGIDQDCNGVDLIDLTLIDNDSDGINAALDCNDNDANIHPGATEIRHDSIDQDCNGYDLTIDILKAAAKGKRNATLTVDATSGLGADANLVLEGYGPMEYNSRTNEWSLIIRKLRNPPKQVTVSGPEGAVSVLVEYQTR